MDPVPGPSPEAVAMKAESEKRIALSASASKPAAPVVPAKPESTPILGAQDDSAGKGSAAAGPAKPGNPPPASAPAAVVDLSFVPEKHRSFFEKAPADVLAYLSKEYGEENGKLRWSDYSKKTSALSDERKALEQRKVAADFGDAVMSDEGALEALREYQRKGTKGAGSAAPAGSQKDWDPALATKEEWAEHEAALRDEIKAEIKAEMEAQRSSETGVQRERVEITSAVVAEFGEDRVKEEVNPLFMRLGSWPGVAALAKARGESFTKETVVRILRELLPAREAPKPPAAVPPASTPQGSPPVSGLNGNGSGGASALSRGAGVSAPVTLPRHVREGRPAATLKERIEQTMAEVNRHRAAKGLELLTP